MTDSAMSRTIPHAALLVVDIQYDFLPDGALAIADGDQLLEPIGSLMNAGRFATIVATQDWHPAGHISFASSHPGHRPYDAIALYGREQVLWPDHCVAGSDGARLHAGLPWELAEAIIRKGNEPEVDSYSAFRNNWNREGRRPTTGLGGYLRDRGIETVFLCGLARDYCVKWSAEDALELGFTTHVLWDLTRPVDASADDETQSSLAARGVHIVDSGRIDAIAAG